MQSEGWVLEQLPPRKTFPLDIFNFDDCCPRNCPQGKLPPPLLKIYLLIIKFPPKIVASSQANSPQAVLWMNWRKLCIVYEYYSQRIILPKVFLRQQIRIKKWFTSIYLLQILAKTYKRTSFTKCLLIFLRQNEKNNIFWKNLFAKKYKKTS